MYIKKKWFVILFSISFAVLLFNSTSPLWMPFYYKIFGNRTIDDILRKYEKEVNLSLSEEFYKRKVSYPPKKIAILVFKEERVLELWDVSTSNKLIKTYNLKAFSGTLGPKLREGDRQIPEGAYKIIALNPNSSYHLSLKISYPNEFDVLKATQDGRKNLGDNIFIHGSNRSIGCVAIGNNSIEELFVLIAKIGKENVSVIIAPNDIRKGNHQFQECNDCPKWINELYYQLDQQIKQFR